MTRRVALGLTLGLLLSAAGPDQPALHWVRGDSAQSCIDPRSLAQRVQSITGPTLVSAAQADASIEARIEHAAGRGFTLHMRIDAGHSADGGARVLAFDTEDCRSLDATIAFVIAMAIDPELGAQGIPAELSWVDEQDAWATAESLRHELSVEAPPAAPIAEPAAPAKEPESATALPSPPHATQRWQLLSAATGGSGRDTGPAAGLVLALSRRLAGRFSVAAQLGASSALTSRELAGGRAVLTQSFELALLACLQWPLSASLGLRGCVGPELSTLVASGQGYAPNKTALLPDAGGALRLDVGRPLDRHWALAAGILFHVGIDPPRLHDEHGAEQREVFRAARFVVQAALGVSHDF